MLFRSSNHASPPPFPMSRSGTKTHLRLSSLGATLWVVRFGLPLERGGGDSFHPPLWHLLERERERWRWLGMGWGFACMDNCACEGHLHRMVGTARALHACWLDYAWSSTSIALHHDIIIFAFSPPSCYTRTCKGHTY